MRRALIVVVTIVGVSGGLIGTAQAASAPGLHKTGPVVLTVAVKDRFIYWPYPERL